MTEKACTSSSPLPPLSPGTMRLYSMRFCPYAHRPRLVLAHKEIEYETININLSDKPSWLNDRNPNGSIPVLEHYEGKVVYESLVISDYLDDLYPDNRLTPSDPYRRARDSLLVDQWAKVVTCFYKLIRKDAGSEEAEEFHKTLDIIEKVCAKRGTFFGGESVKMVDFMMWTYTERFEALVQLYPAAELATDRFPNFIQWIENMGNVHAVQKCRWDTASHLHFLESMQDGSPDYDYGL